MALTWYKLRRINHSTPLLLAVIISFVIIQSYSIGMLNDKIFSLKIAIWVITCVFLALQYKAFKIICPNDISDNQTHDQFLKTQLERMQSRPQLLEILKKYDLYEVYNEDINNLPNVAYKVYSIENNRNKIARTIITITLGISAFTMVAIDLYTAFEFIKFIIQNTN